jgi:hypothetical protein
VHIHRGVKVRPIDPAELARVVGGNTNSTELERRARAGEPIPLPCRPVAK